MLGRAAKFAPSKELHNLFSRLNESACLRYVWSIWANTERQIKKAKNFKTGTALGIFRNIYPQEVLVPISTHWPHSIHLLPHVFWCTSNEKQERAVHAIRGPGFCSRSVKNWIYELLWLRFPHFIKWEIWAQIYDISFSLIVPFPLILT